MLKTDIEHLLDEIRERTTELRVLAAHGVRPAALADRKRELSLKRDQLASLAQ